MGATIRRAVGGVKRGGFAPPEQRSGCPEGSGGMPSGVCCPETSERSPDEPSVARRAQPRRRREALPHADERCLEALEEAAALLGGAHARAREHLTQTPPLPAARPPQQQDV